MAASAAVWATATVSCWAEAAALLALACISHARYGPCAPINDSALGPSHTPACTLANTAVSSWATDAYSALKVFHAPAAASKAAGPGPLLSNAECTSGGAAIQMGAAIRRGPPDPPPPHHRSHNWRPTRPPLPEPQVRQRRNCPRHCPLSDAEQRS